MESRSDVCIRVSHPLFSVWEQLHCQPWDFSFILFVQTPPWQGCLPHREHQQFLIFHSTWYSLMSCLHFTYHSAYVIFYCSVSTSVPLECKVLETKAFNLFLLHCCILSIQNGLRHKQTFSTNLFPYSHLLLCSHLPSEYVLSSSVLSQMIDIEDHACINPRHICVWGLHAVSTVPWHAGQSRC